MDLQLKGKRAIVTGSTVGIGLAIAVELAREGASVVINGRTQKCVNEAIAAVGPKASGFVGELSTPSAAAATLIAKCPDVEILINNLSIYESWQWIWQVHVKSGIRLSRHYLPRMIAARWGRILFVSSESDVRIPAKTIHYGITKTAQVALARSMAETTAGTGVTVNSVLVRPTKSEGMDELLSFMARQIDVDAAAVEHDYFAHGFPSSLLKRFIEPDPLAHLVVYLSSPLSSATNGAALRVDGGVIRSIL